MITDLDCCKEGRKEEAIHMNMMQISVYHRPGHIKIVMIREASARESIKENDSSRQ